MIKILETMVTAKMTLEEVRALRDLMDASPSLNGAKSEGDKLSNRQRRLLQNIHRELNKVMDGAPTQ